MPKSGVQLSSPAQRPVDTGKSVEAVYMGLFTMDVKGVISIMNRHKEVVVHMPCHPPTAVRYT